MKIDERSVLALNPFWVSELIGHFSQGYGRPCPFLLVYLVSPLVLRKESRERISRLNASSTIYSAFVASKGGRLQVAGLQKHVDYYSYLVAPSLIAYANKGNNFGAELRNGKPYSYQAVKNRGVREYCRAAHYLGVIFSKEKTAECFYKLGVFQI